MEQPPAKVQKTEQSSTKVPQRRCFVIGLHGNVGHGKDTVADILVDHHGFHKLSFAEPLRQALVVLFGIPMEFFADRQLKEMVLPQWGKSPRQLMQLLGTELLRTHIAEDFLVRRVDEEINKLEVLHEKEREKSVREFHLTYDDPVKIVITDCRFANEAKWIGDEFPGKSIILHVNASERVSPVLSGAASVHASENGGITREMCSGVLDNNGTILNLHREIQKEIGLAFSK